MKVIVEVLGGAIEQFTYIAMLLFLMIFIISLLGMEFFGGKFKFDEQARVRQNFDSFPMAFLTVFQILTLENWTDILYNCMRSGVNPLLSIVYLILWIFIGNFIFLNLFLAILLDGFGSSDTLNMKEEIEAENGELDRIYKEKVVEHENFIKKREKLLEDNEAIVNSLYQSVQQHEIIYQQDVEKKNARSSLANSALAKARSKHQSSDTE